MRVTMTRKKIILITALGMISIFLLAALYIVMIRPRPSKGHSALIKAIPTDAALIMQCSRPLDFLTELTRTDYWSDLTDLNNLSSFTSTLSEADSAIRSHSRLMDLLSEYPSAISWHLDESGHSSLLYLLELPSIFHRRTIRSFIGDITSEGHTTSSRHKGKTVYRTHTSGDSEGFYFSFIKGLFLAGTDSVILMIAIDHGISGGKTIWEDPSFKRAYGTIGKMVYAHAFINNRMLAKKIPLLLNMNGNQAVKSFSMPSGWTALDLVIKQKEMILNGFTAVEDTSSTFCHLYKNMPPQVMSVHNILPYNTVFSVQTGIDQFNVFMDKLIMNKRIDDTLFNRQILSMEEPSLVMDLEKRMESIAGPEMCLAFTGLYGSSLAHNAYLIIRTTHIENSRVSLNLLSDPSTKHTVILDGATIKKLIIPNPFKIVFEPLASENPFEWYTILDDYIIFGETASSIHKFISYYRSGRTLGRSPLYAEYLDNFPDQSNLILNMNIRNAGDAVLSLLNDSLVREIRQNRNVLDRFDGLAIQFSAMEGLIYTNIHFNYHPDYLEESPYLWKTTLDTTIQKGPFIVRNPASNKGNIIVFDNLNQVVLIDENGSLQWKAMLSGPVLSQVYQVDLNRGSKGNMLFNTEDYLYMFDMKGHPAANYPIPLQPKAANGITVLDYDKDKDYRIILSCEDRKIYNYDIGGNPVKGWKIPETDSQISFPLQHLVAAGKDYLIFTQQDGQVLMTDRKGLTRLRIEKSFVNSTRSDFYIDRSKAGGTLLTTDIYGSVIFITPSGKIRKDSFGDFLPDHYFSSADFNNDNNDDFIFLDRNRLTIFSRNKEIIYEYSFEDQVDHEPIILDLPSKGVFLGFYSLSSGNVYLFSKDGQAFWTEGMKGDRSFQVGNLVNKETFQLVTGYKNEVMTYLFE